MHDHVLDRLRRTLHERLTPHGTWLDEHGEVDQSRTASRLFAGDYSTSATVGEEFGGSLLGLGVMHDLDGEVVSLRGRTWRVPVDGVPREVEASDGIAFGVAAHGGREHALTVPVGADMTGILAAVDAYLHATHEDPHEVVCAVELVGEFTGVILRTVAPPTHENEALAEVIDDETRYSFADWRGTLVGFRFPEDADSEVIPGLHLHGIGDDLRSGGHVREATTGEVVARIWVDDFHPLQGGDADGDTGAPIDFARLEGSASGDHGD